jgi:hypothetical protein
MVDKPTKTQKSLNKSQISNKHRTTTGAISRSYLDMYYQCLIIILKCDLLFSETQKKLLKCMTQKIVWDFFFFVFELSGELQEYNCIW